MSRVDFGNLIVFPELTKALESLYKTLSKHDSRLSSLEKQREEDKTPILQQEIESLKRQSEQNTKNLLDMPSIHYKLNQWSDRFTTIEEKQFKTSEDIQKIEDKLSKIKIENSRQHLNFSKDLESYSENYTRTEQNILFQLENLAKDIENMKTEMKSQALSSEEVKFPESMNDKEFQAFKEERIAVLEKRVNEISGKTAVESLGFSSLSNTDSAIEAQEMIIFMREQLVNLENAYNHIETNTEPPQYISYSQRLEKAEKLLNKVDLTFSNHLLQCTSNTPPIEQQHVELVCPNHDRTKEELQHLNIIFNKKFDNLEEYSQKLQKEIEKCAQKAAVEEVKFMLNQKKPERISRSESFALEVEQKVIELEQRLNTMWKQTKDTSKDIQNQSRSLSSITESFEKHLRQTEELFSSNLSETSMKLKGKIAELGQEVKQLHVAINEMPINANSNLKSFISLRSEVSKLKQSVEDIRTVEPLSPAKSEIFIEEVTEHTSDESIKKILMQHSKAIKFLANKIATNNPVVNNVETKPTSELQLEHLEQLKREMKEIINQRTRIVSQKDAEIIEQIHSIVETKINKLEVGNKVDKTSLRNLYVLLKNKIDAVSKQIEIANKDKPEEPFFIKGKFEDECASCGHHFHNRPNTRSVYTTWSRFPKQKHLVGPGFSKILSSIVATPDSKTYTLPR